MQEQKTKTITAVVSSKSGDKSIGVVIDYKVKHPRYGKYIKRRTKLMVHDAQNEAQIGDLVEICECRPMSKHKNWRFVKVLKKAVNQ